MEEKQTNYTIMEGYELPSGGKIYDVPVNPHVELRSMTARDEMKRLAPSTTPLKTLADLIENCMIEKPAIHVYDMALGDYEFLLHKLRVVTYGEDYKMVAVCPECGHSFTTTTKLSDLEVKDFDLAEFEALQEFTLPKSGKKIKLHFATPRILDEVQLKTKEMARKYKTANIDFEILVRLEENIDTVDGAKLSKVELETFINNLPALDMTKISNNIDRLNKLIGLDNSVYLNCPECGEEFVNFFRFGSEFFRPTNI